jgi:Uma2 family endonuclease
MAGDAAETRDPGRNDPAVEEAFEAAPETVIAEILDGELSLMSRPARRHTRSSSGLGVLLGGPFGYGLGGPGGWVILDEPELHFGPRPDKVVPDLAGWRRERMPDALGPEDGPAHFDLAPDWVCEVVSPSSQARDRGVKMRIYRRENVAHYWLVDPVLRTLEVYELEGGRYFLVDTFEGHTRVRAAPFEAVELDLALLWAA